MFWERPAVLPPPIMFGIMCGSTLLKMIQAVMNGSPNAATATPYSAETAAPNTTTPSSSFTLRALSAANHTVTMSAAPIVKWPSLRSDSVSVNR